MIEVMMTNGWLIVDDGWLTVDDGYQQTWVKMVVH